MTAFTMTTKRGLYTVKVRPFVNYHGDHLVSLVAGGWELHLTLDEAHALGHALLDESEPTR